MAGKRLYLPDVIESFTTSTPITFLKFSEKYILVVPIPEYKSSNTLFLLTPKYSFATL